VLLSKPAGVRALRVVGDGGEGIAISCRVRLARNLRGERFPDWATERDRLRVLNLVGPAVVASVDDPHARFVSIGDLDETTLDLLCERHLISADLADRGKGGGLVVSRDEQLAVMINEEDHLRIQAIRTGLDVRRAWEVADAVDTHLESRLAYAYTPRLGYLTACPSNVGTGMRASVMVHLLGLRLTNDLDAVIRALERMRLAVRGVGGEGSEAAGHMFQISNPGTLGQDEASIIDGLLRVVNEVVRQERQARLRLLRDSPEVLLDCLARALAVVQHARVMQTDESLDYLSALRLGVILGLIRRLTVPEIDAWVLAVQPGHLQKRLGKILEPEQRDILRATLLRDQLADASLRE
jgi:protein arginine kinase